MCSRGERRDSSQSTCEKHVCTNANALAPKMWLDHLSTVTPMPINGEARKTLLRDSRGGSFARRDLPAYLMASIKKRGDEA